MAKYFIFAGLVFSCCAAGFIGYGVYLNSQSVSYIASVHKDQAVAVQVVTATRQTLQSEVPLRAVDLFAPNMIDIIAKVSGTIKKIHVSVGQEVSKGQVLCELSDPNLEYESNKAMADIQKARAELLQAENTLRRSEALRNEGAISQSEYEQNLTAREAAQATLTASTMLYNEIQENIQDLTIRSPLDGNILSVYYREGTRITAGTPIMLPADFTTLRFTTQVPEEDFQKLMPMDKEYEVVVNLTHDFKTFTVSYDHLAPQTDFLQESSNQVKGIFDAKILSVSPSPETKAKFRRILWALSNPAKLLEAGLYTNVIIRKKAPHKVLAVPAWCLRRSPNGDGSVVYVQKKDGSIEVRPVTTGITNTNLVELVSGVEEGEMIILSDITDLPTGIKVTVLQLEGES